MADGLFIAKPSDLLSRLIEEGNSTFAVCGKDAISDAVENDVKEFFRLSLFHILMIA